MSAIIDSAFAREFAAEWIAGIAAAKPPRDSRDRVPRGRRLKNYPQWNTACT